MESKFPCVAADERYVYAGADKGVVHVWRQDTWELVTELKPKGEHFTCDVALGHGRVYSASGYHVYIWEKDSWNLYAKAKGNATIFKVAVGGVLLYAAEQPPEKEGLIRIWPYELEELADTFPIKRGVEGLFVDDKFLYCTSAMDGVMIWDMTSWKKVADITGPKEGAFGVATSDRYLYVGWLDGPIYAYAKRAWQKVGELQGHDSFVTDMATDGKVMVSASVDKSLRVWDLKSGRCLARLGTGSLNYYSVAIHRPYVFAGTQKTVEVWELPTA